MKTQTIQVDHSIEELFCCPNSGTIDAKVVVTLEFDEPDPSVGYRGGCDIIDVELVEYTVYENSGVSFVFDKKAIKQGKNKVIFKMIERQAYEHCEKIQDRLMEVGSDKLKDEEEFYAEQRAEARREARYGY